MLKETKHSILHYVNSRGHSRLLPKGDDGFYEDIHEATEEMGPSGLRLKQQYQANMMRKPILEEMSDEEEEERSKEEDGMGWIRESSSRTEVD